MALPTWIAKGVFASGTGALTVGVPAGFQDNDLFLLLVESANEAIATPAGWTQVANSPRGTGTAALAGGVRLAVFYKIVTGAQAAVSVADTGNHTTAQIHCFRGVNTTTPINVTAGSVDAAATTAITCPSVTTTVGDTLIVHCIGLDKDLNDTDTITTAYTNANLTSITERHDQAVNLAAGGGLAVITGGFSALGTTGTTTATADSSTTHAYITLALTPQPITGTLVATETGDDTTALAATVSVQADLAATETGNDTAALTATVLVQADLAAQETGSDTSALTGQVLVQAVVDATDSPDTAAITASVRVFGYLASQEVGADTAALDVDVLARGALTVSEVGADTASIFGDVIVSITADITDAPDTASLTAKVLVSATVGVTEPATDNFNSSAASPIAGSLAANDNLLDTSQIVAKNLVSLSATLTEAGQDTASITSKVLVQGALDIVESGEDTASITGKVYVTGVAELTELGSDVASIAGTILVTATVSIVESVDDTIQSLPYVDADYVVPDYIEDGVIAQVSVRGTFSGIESGVDVVSIQGVVVPIGVSTAGVIKQILVKGRLNKILVLDNDIQIMVKGMDTSILIEDRDLQVLVH